MSTVKKLKTNPDLEDEIRDVRRFHDAGFCHVTPVATFPPEVGQAVVDSLCNIVRAAHNNEATSIPDENGIVRAQIFEEGDVYMLAAPFEGYFADRYIMDFYDVNERDTCSRMHLHTGLRFVRMMTGPGTRIRVASLSPFRVTNVPGVTPFQPPTFIDELPDAPNAERIARYNLIVDENSWVDMQIPRGVSHQFNAIGPNAVIDSVHPEESIEILREEMSSYNMTAQTIFLSQQMSAAESCNTIPTTESTRIS
jgi:hypothetical protein